MGCNYGAAGAACLVGLLVAERPADALRDPACVEPVLFPAPVLFFAVTGTTLRADFAGPVSLLRFGAIAFFRVLPSREAAF